MNGLEESVARELLTRSGIEVIWQAHVAAETAYRIGNNRAAEILLKIADAAETIWRDEDPCHSSAAKLSIPGIATDSDM